MTQLPVNPGVVSQLLADGVVSEQQLQRALEYHTEIGGRLEHIMVNLGVIQRDDLVVPFSKYLNLKLFSDKSEDLAIRSNVLPGVDLTSCYKQGFLPFATEGTDYCVAVTDPLNLHIFELLPAAFSYQWFMCHQAELDALYAQLQSEFVASSLDQSSVSSELERLRELAFGAPTVHLVNKLIVRGIKLKASDMHVEPVNGRYRVRYRVDGILHEADSVPQDLQLGVISRIKILAGMDIAERRKPQDGKIETSVAGRELDIRVSVLPLGDGESIVMRFLLKESISFSLDKLGYEQDLIRMIYADLQRTTGVILMTGPTGSGKTTSLYSFLAKLNKPDVKIITLEDPIEYQLDGINQVQVNPDIGFDFSKGLRSIVRQDPDIIMVGEIRDQETARIAMQSSLTGHLVFSTVHTNDAPTTFTRLLDLGVEEFLLNASVISVMAQRLTRKICPHCSAPAADAAAIEQMPEIIELCQQYGLSPDIRKGKGCDACGGTGYAGRIAILEYLPNNADIQAMHKGAGFQQQVAEYRQRHKLRTLKQDGLLKAIQGLTTLEEVLRVAN